MVWRDLAFLHWPQPADLLQALLPPGLEIDTFDGVAWLGVVPFAMESVCPRYTPRIPRVSDFPELNLRTYVNCGTKPGVFFFSLDAASWLGVRMARRFFHLPYFDAQISISHENQRVHYMSERTHRAAPPALFEASYWPTGPITRSQPGSPEYWFTERYCLYSVNKRGQIYRGEIHHAPWPLQTADCEIRRNTMTGQIGLSLQGPPRFAHVAESLHVRAWLIEPAIPR